MFDMLLKKMVIKCNYDHYICFGCFDKLKYKCEFCHI